MCAHASGTDLAVHTVGVQGVGATATGTADVDLLVGERLRWSVSDRTRVWLDARFLLDPSGDPTFERARVRRLGASYTAGPWTLWVGRHPLVAGGPRLVDGIQAVVDVGSAQLGVWAGLAPDLFTTAPRFRPGFGPLLTLDRPVVSVRAAGELAVAADPDGGGLGLDRAAFVGSARVAPSRRLSFDGRLDVELVSPEGSAHLADGWIGVRGRPTEAVTVSGFYDVFSSLRYLRTESLDANLRRFDARILAEGLSDGFDQDTRDPALNHLVGLDLAVRAPTEEPTPVGGFKARYRHHPDPKNRFTSVTTWLGVAGIGGRLELDALAVLRQVDAIVQGDVGAQAIVALGDGCCQVDGSAMLIVDPARLAGPGAYGDLFVDVIGRKGTSLGVGTSTVVEPLPLATDVGIGGFVRVTHHQRRVSSDRPGGTGRTPRS